MIGILNAYHFEADADYQIEYSKLFVDFVKQVFPERQNEVKEYKIALGDFPKSPDECDIWFITGSPKSVYDDIDWIHKLADFTKQLHAKKKKTIAICFGHQMIAHALGGKVSKSEKGWGVGIRSFNVMKNTDWMIDKIQQMSLLFSHQDQVQKLPPQAELLAGDDFCPNQMFQIENHILTLQGHPEFTVQFAKDRLISRKQIIAPGTFDTAMLSYNNKNDFKLATAWIRKFAANN